MKKNMTRGTKAVHRAVTAAMALRPSMLSPEKVRGELQKLSAIRYIMGSLKLKQAWVERENAIQALDFEMGVHTVPKDAVLLNASIVRLEEVLAVLRRA